MLKIFKKRAVMDCMLCGKKMKLNPKRYNTKCSGCKAVYITEELLMALESQTQWIERMGAEAADEQDMDI